MTAPRSPAPEWFLVCIAGPDAGKRLALSPGTLTVGRGAGCNIRSDDPEIAEEFATLHFDGTRVRIHALTDTLPATFVAS